MKALAIPRLSVASPVRAAALLALAAAIAMTPSFFSTPSLRSLLTTISFVGCVAAGMTMISLSGNIMSLALGVTTAAASVMFASAVNAGGLAVGVVAALALGTAVTAIQGFAIGWTRANPIIISIAAFALIKGAALWATGGAEIYITTTTSHHIFRTVLFGIPTEFIVFLGVIAVGQYIISFTTFGRNILMAGGSLRAANAAGIRTWRTVTGVYFWAGLFSAIPGILLTARYNSGSMEYALEYDYDAIAAVLVGGNSIIGGKGSLIRTLVGVLLIGAVENLLLLHGFRQEWQLFIIGVVVLAVIMLQKAEH